MDGNGFIDNVELQEAFKKRGHELTLDEVFDLTSPFKIIMKLILIIRLRI